MLLERLKSLECSLHDDKRNDREWLEEILHEEFREITRSGMLVDRAETIEALSTEDKSPIIHSDDFRLIIVRKISPYCITGLLIQMAVMPLFVPHAGK